MYTSPFPRRHVLFPYQRNSTAKGQQEDCVLPSGKSNQCYQRTLSTETHLVDSHSTVGRKNPWKRHDLHDNTSWFHQVCMGTGPLSRRTICQPHRPEEASNAKRRASHITYRSSLEHEATEMEIGKEGKCLSKLPGQQGVSLICFVSNLNRSPLVHNE